MKAVAMICLMLVAVASHAQSQPGPQPIRPSAQYQKKLQRYQAIQAKRASDQRKFNEQHLNGDIEAAGLEKYLSVVCSVAGQIDCIPQGYGVNPNLDGGLFVPLPPPPPEKPKESEVKPEAKTVEPAK